MAGVAPKSLRTDGKFDLSQHLQKILQTRGWGLAPASEDLGSLRMHSHCAGADAPSFAIQALAIPHVLEAASELDPHMAFST